jgi:glycosyltransferase involved in cell wall biosynthesis
VLGLIAECGRGRPHHIVKRTSPPVAAVQRTILQLLILFKKNDDEDSDLSKKAKSRIILDRKSSYQKRFVKILFIVGSLEPGKDGVGDYTRTLGAECARLGYETFLMSLNDWWIDKPSRGSRTLRLPSTMPWASRIKAGRTFLVENHPDLVSLQYVPYSFHPAGLSFALPKIVQAIIGRVPAHLMLHELWIGSQIGAPFKVKVFGFCQRRITKSLVTGLALRVIHTSNVVYARLLSRHGIHAKILPLFGSVPVTANAAVTPRDDNVLRLGLFGSIHPEWSPEELFARLQALGKRIHVCHIGRIGPGESLWNEVVHRYDAEIQFQRFGEQSFENISQFFLSVDLGVATTPLSLIGKSSTVAAMLDHGLPVIVSRNDVHFQGIAEENPASERLIRIDENFLDRVKAIKRLDPDPSLPRIAKQFLSDLASRWSEPRLHSPGTGGLSGVVNGLV